MKLLITIISGCIGILCLIDAISIVTGNEFKNHIRKSKVRGIGLDGPVYTFVKTDEQANIKWGIRHYVPRRH